jgi:hypothetical protein
MEMVMMKWLKSLFSSSGTVPAVIETVMAEPKAKKTVVKSKAPAKKAPAKKATIKKADLAKLTKAQLEVKGREFGLEIDKRKKKEELVKEVLKASKI